jgi:hypothetical protein
MIPYIKSIEDIEAIYAKRGRWRARQRIIVFRECIKMLRVLGASGRATAEQVTTLRARLLPELKQLEQEHKRRTGETVERPGRAAKIATPEALAHG